jgi:site-specific recombinase XerD
VKRHPAEIGTREIGTFLSHLATKHEVAMATQNQALSALLFLYKEVLYQEIEWVTNVEHAKHPKRLPVVFTKKEVQAVLGHLRDKKWLMASLLYGSGLRLMECLRLRVKNVDFAQQQIKVRESRGAKIA